MLALKNNIVEGKGIIDIYNGCEYGNQDAVEAYRRVARDHGWDIGDMSWVC